MQSRAVGTKPLTVCHAPRPVARPRRVVVRAATSDHSVRVRGDIKKVFKYLSDLRHYADFDDSIVECYKVGTPGRVSQGTRFEVVHSPFPAVNIPVQYEVAELIPHKRIVFTGNNDNFVSTKTLALMSHPAQKEYTVVRQFVEYKMKDWKSMIPMLDRQLAKREEASALTLEKVLNSKSSPLLRLEMKPEDLRTTKVSSSSSSGSYMSLDLDEQTNKLKDFGNMIGNLFTGIGSSGASTSNGSSTNGSSSSSSSYNGQSARASSSYSSYGGESTSSSYSSSEREYSSSTATLVPSDPLGYYQVLGLDTSKAVSEDDIKAAFRVAAQQVHPDKVANADPRTQQAAKIQFQILQAAYSTLKDPVKRNMYDRGQMSYSPDV